MNIRKQLINATAALFLATGAATAWGDEGPAFEDEMKTCLAAVSNHIDFEHATRVRHDVVELKNTYVGYVLEIDTRVFEDSSDSASRVYSAYCVAKGSGEPRNFRIHEVTG